MKTNAERQADFKKRCNEAGLFKKSFYLTKSEYLLLKAYLDELRKGAK